MNTGRYSLVVYIGSGEKGRLRRTRLEEAARAHGYVKKGKVKLSPYIVDKLEDSLAKEEATQKS